MLTSLELVGDTLHIHESKTTCSGTSTFKAGTIIIDPKARTFSMGKSFSAPLPEGYVPSDARPLKLQLVDNTGMLKKQTRTEMLTLVDPEGKIKPTKVEELKNLDTAVYRVTGKSSAKSRSAKDRWGYRVLKFRVYLTHEGVVCDKLHAVREYGDTSPVPDSYWMTDLIHLSRLFWNRMVRRCEHARSICETAPIEDIQAFISGTVLPAIDEMNQGMGRSQNKLKLKHPNYLKVQAPSVDGLRRFAYLLKMLAKDSKPVPVGLEDAIRDFVNRYPITYDPINKFQAEFKDMAKKEAANFQLPTYAENFLTAAFATVLSVRKEKMKAAKEEGERLSFSAGWPRYKMGDSPLKEDWGLHFVTGRANDPAEMIVGSEGIRGIRLGEPIAPVKSGHPLMGIDPTRSKQLSRRKLRQATIALDHGSKVFRFAVLQTQEIPQDAFVKGWKLICKGGQLWLNYIIEVQNPVPAVTGKAAEVAAGLDVGWRQTDAGMRIGMLWDPKANQYQEIVVNLTESPTATDVRRPFQVAMGPSRHGRHTLKLLHDAKGLGLEDRIPEYLNRGVDTFAGLTEMQVRRDEAKNLIKERVEALLGDATPPRWEKYGLQGMRKFLSTCNHPQVVDEVSRWMAEDKKIGDNYAALWAKVTSRRDKGYEYIAHDICKQLWGRVTRIGIEKRFLKKMIERGSKNDPEAVRRSQVYRQWASLSTFITTLHHTALKYGITVVEVEAKNTTAKCFRCHSMTHKDAALHLYCPTCKMDIDQDMNAAFNIGMAAAVKPSVKNKGEE